MRERVSSIVAQLGEQFKKLRKDEDESNDDKPGLTGYFSSQNSETPGTSDEQVLDYLTRETINYYINYPQS